MSDREGSAPASSGSDLQRAIDTVFRKNEVWKSLDGDTFITSTVNRGDHEHLEHWPIYSKQGQGLLIMLLSEAAETLISGKAVEEAQNRLSALAMINSTLEPVYLRVAHYQGDIYIDLCDSSWDIVHISPIGWRVIGNKDCPVRFRRSSYALPLPRPEKGGSLNLLEKYLNVESRHDFLMLVSWMIGTFNPADEQTILMLNGRPGSAKSSTAGLLRQLLDPSRATFRGAPKNEEAAILAAHNNWVLCFDNVRKISPKDGDVFCRLATTAGFGTRKLYADREEIIFDGVRPVILNGLGKINREVDFLDRTIVIDHGVITNQQRQRKLVIKRLLEADKPKILGALYDVLVVCLQNMDRMEIPECGLPRMADFAYWVLCGEEAIGWQKGEFLAVYDAFYQQSLKSATEGNKLMNGVEKILDENAGYWEGSATELLQALREVYPDENEDLPSAANKLAEELSRFALVLELKGITVEKSRTGPERTIILCREARNDDHDDDPLSFM